ncbi:hypothetical protein SPSYN_00780 [Sporotomaculum syntrophicum]|uniref:Carboxypeptidase regulatory-like domain-containing protein n=1 Tax=Sporotomaculum syntrophicum TaxID=182264 RepID=A0A9D2WR06_9FIRM|nr:hypothetical protein [Sporotomaculum syntrophicum]KAF1086042.1 hypothetical protein SPSYN_00780 [Sporotomaculum syntrophicum]
MSQRNNKFMLIMSIVALCCFMFAGAAMAADNNLEVKATADCFGPNYALASGKATYVFEATGLNLNASCFGYADNVTIAIDFDSTNKEGDFDLSATTGLTVPVKVYTNDGNWYFAQPTAQIAGNVVTLSIPAMQELVNSEAKVNTIVVGDKLQNIIATAPCQEETYCFKMTVSGCCNDALTKMFPVYYWPAGVVDVQYAAIEDACSCLYVTGKVVNCNGDGMSNVNVGVQVKAKDDCNWETISNLCSGNVKTNAKGEFGCGIPTDQCAGEYEFRIVAERNDVISGIAWNKSNDKCKFVSEPYGFKLIGNAPVTVAWKECPTNLKFNKCNELTIQLLDDCACKNLATNEIARVIKLDAFYTNGGIPEVAGHFYATAQDCAADQNQIGSIVIPAGQNQVTVYLKPIMSDVAIPEAVRQGGTVDIPIKLVASSANLTSAVCDTNISLNNNLNLEVKPLATNVNDKKARAAWPLEAAVWLDTLSIPGMGAADNYSVCVKAYQVGEQGGELKDFVVSTELIAAYSPDADCIPCDFDKCTGCQDLCRCFNATYCTVKQHFYIYVPESWAGKTVQFEASFMNEQQVVITSNVVEIAFVTPVELMRELDFDRWQLISTPKYLAKKCVEANGNPEAYGTFKDLLDANGVKYSKIITWDETAGEEINNWRVVDPTEVVEPLKAYFVKTSQRGEFGTADYVAEYVFARVTHPSLMMPQVRNLNAGWNLVGVSVNDTNKEDGRPLYRQSDDIYLALGSMYKGSKLVWNPGQYLGNLAEWISYSWVTPNGEETDEYAELFNGDGYWAYLTEWQQLAANIGQDLIYNGK